MIKSIAAQLPRNLPFLAINIVAALFIVSFIVVPLATGFIERSDRIADAKEQLARILALQRSSIDARSEPNAMLLQGSDEGAVSAAMQADLKSTVVAAGARFLAARSLEPVGFGDSKLLSVGLEFEGSIYAVRQIVHSLEDRLPALLVKSASLHGVSAEQDAAIHADIIVQGLMRSRPPESGAGTTDQESGRGR